MFKRGSTLNMQSHYRLLCEIEFESDFCVSSASYVTTMLRMENALEVYSISMLSEFVFV